MRSAFFLMLFFAFTFHACHSITERMPHFEVHGIDVSHHQVHINWDTVAVNAIDFAFVKATEGGDHIDSLFCYNWDEMRRTNIKRGAYHFFRPKTNPHLQAQHFIDMVILKTGDLPPVLDVETLDDVQSYQLVQNMITWLHLIEDHYGVRPIIYTNLKFYHTYLAGLFDEYPIWMARYNTTQPFLTQGNDWVFWQYGNRGLVNGIDGFVDLNVFKGNLFELDKMSYTPKILYSFKD